MTIGRGKPTKAINQRTAPSEKNQNSSAAQSRSVTVARAKTVKNVCVRAAQIGRRKTAKTVLTQRVGIMSASGMGLVRVVGTAYGTILTRPCDLRRRFFVDL